MAISESPTVAALAANLSEHDERIAQRFAVDGSWQTRSYAQLHDRVVRLASAIVAHGVRPGDRVGLLAETSPEWTVAQLAIALSGATMVPIYATSSAEECHWVLSDSGAVAVLAENADRVEAVQQVRDRLPDLRTIWTFADEAGAADATTADLVADAEPDTAELAARVAAVQPDDPAMMIYTSGTTGQPKGCVLTQHNVVFSGKAMWTCDVVHPEDDMYLYLPLAHCFAQVMQCGILLAGGTVSYASARTARITQDMAEIRPTNFPSVPRILEKIYAQFAEMPRTEETYAKVREALGGRIRLVESGGAPILPELVQFYWDAGVPLVEGFGLTETTACAILGTPTDFKVGTLGKPMPGLSIRIADDGEMLLRGENVFTGYWNNPDATAEAFTDGWFHTGDLGAIDDDGYVRITGRKKDIIITAGGKNITPALIESALCESPLVSHAMVYGDRKPYLVAILNLDFEAAREWLAAQGLSTDNIPGNEALRDQVRSVVNAVNSTVGPVEQIKRFAIAEREFSAARGELTAKLSMKRQVLADNFASLIEDLYAGGAAMIEAVTAGRSTPR